MTLDDRIRSAVSAVHTVVQEVPMTQQQFDVAHGQGRDAPGRTARTTSWRVVATAAIVAVLVAAAVIPIMRAHPHQRPPQPAATATPSGRLIHPAILGGFGSFRVDPATAITTDSAHVFVTRWSDIDDGSLYVIEPQLVLDPKSAGYVGVPVDLTVWMQSNPRLSLGTPRSVTVDGQLAVQFDYHGTVDGQPYKWLCPDAAHLDCLPADGGGQGTITVISHDDSAYLIYGGAATAAHQSIAISRTNQLLATWRWEQ